MEFKEVEELLGEAERFLELAFEEFNRGLERVELEARDVKLRGSAEKAWNAVVKATEALPASRGYCFGGDKKRNTPHTFSSHLFSAISHSKI